MSDVEVRAAVACLVEILEQNYGLSHRDFTRRIGRDETIYARVRQLRSRLHGDDDWRPSPLPFTKGGYA